MPAFPGAQSREGRRGDRESAQASADSRPPPPTRRTLIARSVAAAGAGAAAPGRGLLLLSATVSARLVRGLGGGGRRAAALLAVPLVEPAAALELEGGTRDELLELPRAFGTLRQRLVVQLLDDLEGVAAGLASVLVDRHRGGIVSARLHAQE